MLPNGKTFRIDPESLPDRFPPGFIYFNRFLVTWRGYFNHDSFVASWDDPLIDKKLYEVVIDKSDTNNIKFLGFPTTHVDFRNYTFYFEE